MYISMGDLQRAGLSGPITDAERAWEQLWKEAKTDEQRRVLAEHHARTRAVRDPNAASNEQIAKAIADQKALRERLAAQPKTQVEASPHTASQYAMSERQRQIDIEIRTANSWINHLEKLQRPLTAAEIEKLKQMKARASAASTAAMELRSAMDRTDRPQTGISLEAGSSRGYDGVTREVGFTASSGAQPLPAKSAQEVSSYWEKIEDRTPTYDPASASTTSRGIPLIDPIVKWGSMFTERTGLASKPQPATTSRPTTVPAAPSPQWDFFGTLTTASRPDPYAASRERLEKIRKESEARTAAIKAKAEEDAAWAYNNPWLKSTPPVTSWPDQTGWRPSVATPINPIHQTTTHLVRQDFSIPMKQTPAGSDFSYGMSPSTWAQQPTWSPPRPTTQGPTRQMISPPAVHVFPQERVGEDVFSQIENKTAYGFPMQMTTSQAPSPSPSPAPAAYTPLQPSQQPQQARPVTQATAYGTPGAPRLPAPGLPDYLYRPQ